jgi:hypothetical protein
VSTISPIAWKTVRVPASGSRRDTRRGSDGHQVHPSASEATLTGRTAHTCFTWRRAPRWERPRAEDPDARPTAGGHPGFSERRRCPTPVRPPGRPRR